MAKIPLSVRATFDAFDADGSNRLRLVELRAALHAIGLPLAAPAVAKALDTYDDDDDKTLSLQEFANLAHGLNIAHAAETRTQHYSTGQRYEGEWRDGLFHGRGTFTFQDGTKHAGLWASGKKHGRGSLVTPDGSVFIGEWSRGLPSRLERQDARLDVK